MNRSLAALVAGIPAIAPLAAVAEPLNYDVINLQADARTEVANDLLVATLFVEQTNSDATKLAADISRAVNQGMKLAKDFPGVKVETGAQSTWPVYDAKNRLTGWRTRAELRLQGKDFDAASRAIAGAAGTLQLGGINFVLSPDTADATENRLIDDAIKAFRVRADIVAKSLGARGWKTVNLNVNSGGRQPPMPMYRAEKLMMAADAVAPQEMAGGNSELSVSVNGTIQLQP